MEGGRSPLYAPLLPPPPAPPPPAPPPPLHLLICPTLPNTMHIAPCPNAALYCVSRLDTLSAPPHPFKPASLAQSLWRCKATFRSKHCSCRAILCVPAKDSWKKYVGRPYLPRPTSHWRASALSLNRAPNSSAIHKEVSNLLFPCQTSTGLARFLRARTATVFDTYCH